METKRQAADRPTLEDFGVMLADAAQRQYTTNAKDGALLNEKTCNSLLSDLGGFADDLAASHLADADLCALMDVVNEYAVKACEIRRQEKANRAHNALTEIITVWGLIKDHRPELWIFSNAAANYDDAIFTASRAQYRREQEAKATAKADEAAELRRRAELADLKRKAGKLGAVITFTEADAAAADDPETAKAPKEGAESHKPETMTDNTPKR